MTLLGYIKAAFVAGTALALVALAIQTTRADDLAAKDKAHRACIAALAPGQPAGDVAKACDLAIASIHARATRAADCDQALAAGPLDLYAVRASCSAPVKALRADRDAQAANAADLTAQLAAERAGRQAAVSRAVAATTTETERKARASAALQAAPRDGDGLVVCDAGCLLARYGQAGARPRP